MRRKDREVTNKSDIMSIIDRADTMHVAMQGDDGYPYVLPFSFARDPDEKSLVLYFHGAKNGMKNRLLAQNDKVCVDISICHGFREAANRGVTTDYESVIAFGRVEKLGLVAAKHALSLILAKAGYPDNPVLDIIVPVIDVYRIIVSSYSGKRSFRVTL